MATFLCPPISISMAMAMISEGAGGQTKQQIEEVFGFDGLDSSVGVEVQDIMRAFNDDTNNYTLSKYEDVFVMPKIIDLSYVDVYAFL